jgi:hypothetical protein
MGSEWENGIGTYTSSGSTLSRDTVLSSSNSGNLVNFSAGTKDVFINYPAGRAAAYDTPSQSTGALHIPVGTTAERPSSPAIGMIRMNSTTGLPEWYDAVSSSWRFFGQSKTFSADYLVIAGGGGGGAAGGGAGGYRTSTGTSGGGAGAENSLYISTGLIYTVIIGAGGSGSTKTGTGGGASVLGSNGNNSSFATITSVGGGRGAVQSDTASERDGAIGGSGSGSSINTLATAVGTAGSGTANQGYAGGTGTTSANYGGGGGGGAGAIGANGTGSVGGNGGTGVASTITGSSVTRAGGGGGGIYVSGTAGTGGSGGGGNGSITNGSNGTANNGGGGGGGGYVSYTGGAGGSGVVIIKIPDTYTATFSGGVTSSLSTSVSGYKIYTVTATSTTSETVTFS